jgi:hypothetical protein
MLHKSTQVTWLFMRIEASVFVGVDWFFQMLMHGNGHIWTYLFLGVG